MASRAPRDFGKGPVWKNILAQALPLTVAQAVLLLYNVVDRIYIGHMGENGAMALTGLGLTFPVVTIVMAFVFLPLYLHRLYISSQMNTQSLVCRYLYWRHLLLTVLVSFTKRGMIHSV